MYFVVNSKVTRICFEIAQFSINHIRLIIYLINQIISRYHLHHLFLISFFHCPSSPRIVQFPVLFGPNLRSKHDKWVGKEEGELGEDFEVASESEVLDRVFSSGVVEPVRH